MASRVGTEVITFYAHGSPTSEVSGPWVPRGNHVTLDILVARATGTSALTVALYKNGVSIGTITTTAVGLIKTGSVAASFAADTDVLTVAATTIGTATTNVTVEVTLI